MTPGALGVMNPHFERFWEVYPKKASKPEAQWAFHHATTNGIDPELIINAAKRVGGEMQFIPNPAKWLRQARYNDIEDPIGAERNWLRARYEACDLAAVENRYQISMDRQYPPDEMTDPQDIRVWYRKVVQEWILAVAKDRGLVDK